MFDPVNNKEVSYIFLMMLPPDPSHASGWSKYCDEKRNEAKALSDDSEVILNKIQDEKSRMILDIYHKIDTE